MFLINNIFRNRNNYLFTIIKPTLLTNGTSLIDDKVLYTDFKLIKAQNYALHFVDIDPENRVKLFDLF